MIILIAGASHTGKTGLAQRMLERYAIPYLSLDHLKMGLIRSSICPLTPLSSTEALTEYLWPIVREMLRTNLENEQSLIVEGCYIPFDWAKDFDPAQLRQMRYVCLAMSAEYIENHYDDILRHANAVEQRLDDDVSKKALLRDNAYNRLQCEKYGCRLVLVDREYNLSPEKIWGTEP